MKRPPMGFKSLLAALGLVAVAACQEKLTTPSKCPELCPIGAPSIGDTTFDAIVGGDSSFVGFVGHGASASGIITTGLSVGESRTILRFPRRSDSITVVGNDTLKPYTIDSLVVQFNLEKRDSLVKGLVVLLHRIRVPIDTLTTFDQVEPQLNPATLIDSVIVPDSAHGGLQRILLTGDKIKLMAVPPGDSGRLAVAFRIRATRPTGIRVTLVGTTGVGGTTTVYNTYARVQVADTSKQRQLLTLYPDVAAFVTSQQPTTNRDVIELGGVPSSRGFIRFAIPKRITDTVNIVRATLELTPARTYYGVPRDSSTLAVRVTLFDFGAKSSANATISIGHQMPDSTSSIVSIDVLRLVGLWKGQAKGLPTGFILAMSPETGTLGIPAFKSSRLGTDGPRLRITYSLPSGKETP